ncbi:MAG TPA: glycosyltransferase, partial [Terriglobia bacterium]|nr:glycosyltransferase [Terriglobia bacterium]
MKRVLFVTYFWPPSGKASLHWPIRMIQYLPSHGLQPCVLTATEDTFSSTDASFEGVIDPSIRVRKARTFEPFNLYRSFLGMDKESPLVASETISRSNPGFRHRIAVWMRMNLFVPDARVGWYFPAVHKAKKFLKAEPVDSIVSIGPPHTALLVGNSLARYFGVPHVPVFIDPWTDIAYYRGFRRSAPTRYFDHHLENSVLNNAARIVFVTESMKQDYVRRAPLIESKSHVLYWGYDEDPFSNFRPVMDRDDQTILHTGNLFDFQNPTGLWPFLRKEIEGGRKLRLVFVG